MDQESLVAKRLAFIQSQVTIPTFSSRLRGPTFVSLCLSEGGPLVAP